MLLNCVKYMKQPLMDVWAVLGLGYQLGHTLLELCEQRARILAGSARPQADGQGSGQPHLVQRTPGT